MIHTGPRWEEAIYGGGQVISRVELLNTGEQIKPLDGSSVTLDITAAVRATATLLFGGPSLVPTTVDSLLAPYGKEFRIWRGVRLSDGYEEMVPLGIYHIQDTNLSEGPDGVVVTVSMSDRAQKAIDAQFESVYSIAPGTDFVAAIITMIGEGTPVGLTNVITTEFDTPTLTGEQGADRWGFGQEMTAMIGCHLYWDNTGALAIQPIASVEDAAVSSIVEGEDGVEFPNLLEIGRTWSRREAHNKWIVTGDNTDDVGGAPPTATAVDDDPNSPTYYDGEFGHKPEMYHSSFITNSVQATDAASGKKAQESGLTQAVSFGSVVNPALEPDDVIQVKRTVLDPDSGELVEIANEKHIIDSLTIPLGTDQPMTGQTRSFRSVSV